MLVSWVLPLLLLWICMVASRLLCGSAAAAIPMACHWLSLPAATLLNEAG
ncbi:hypothetical protein ABNH39_004627 [Enterobacter kobei]